MDTVGPTDEVITMGSRFYPRMPDDEPDWMMRADRDILDFLTRAGKQTPSTIAINIRYSSKHVGRRCSELSDHGFVNSVQDRRGYYEISDLGRRWVNGDISQAELDELIDDE